MIEHLCRHLADALALEGGIPDKPTASTEIDQHFCLGIIHGKCKTITFHSSLVGQRLGKRFSECDGGILYGMVFIYVKITVAPNDEVEFAMACDLFEHVVIKAETGVYVGTAG